MDKALEHEGDCPAKYRNLIALVLVEKDEQKLVSRCPFRETAKTRASSIRVKQHIKT